jgi:peptidoglycan/xylan/chitin deacetylase (PgdA/CDA1 family)
MRKGALVLVLLCAMLLGLGRSFGIPAQVLPHTANPTRQPLPAHPVMPEVDQLRKARPPASQTPRITLPATSPTAISTASPTHTAQLTPTRKWLYHPPGDLAVPILLYHHVAASDTPRRYYVSPADFEAQISSLYDWGYTAIPLSLLVDALLNGAELPPRPVVITFDDGYRDVYQNALPVMQHYGFVGSLFVIVDQIGVGGYLNTRQIAELVEQGWELGSHSQTHPNLRKPGVSLEKEIAGSRDTLEALLDLPVRSFSYPYGSATAAIVQAVKDAGYRSAVGLGGSISHRVKNIYYLSRNEVQGTYDLVTFAGLLR